MNLSFDRNNCFVTENNDKTFKKRILQCGTGDTKPLLWSQARVKINFLDDIETGNINLDGYKANIPTDVTIGEGDGEFAQIVDEVLLTMKKDEWCYVRTKLNAPQNTNSSNSVPDMDNDYTGLRFNVYLQSFEFNAGFGHLEPAKRIQMAEDHKAKGNNFYNTGLIDLSRRQFLRALDYLTSIDLATSSNDIANSAGKLICICHMNLAMGYLKQGQYAKVLEHCDKGLSLEPDNIKGLYRRSQAYVKLGRYSEALSDLSRALEKDPTNKEVAKSHKVVEKLLQNTKP